MKHLLTSVWRWTRRLVLALVVAGIIGAAFGAVFYKQQVVDDPGEHISRDAIMAIIAQESPVLYADGQHRIGVFFAQEHRDYVPYDQIPQAWVDAITSSEDRRFFEHHGVDFKGIVRAMRDNLRAGHVVAGGSTLTQQTAKNLYYRPDRSIRSKWEELLNALRLEAHYSKQDILEFYANQFHVSANGRGLGIAARYFFDKDVSELDTLECAYLAGMVKAPATYNPFLGRSQQRQAQARLRARQRTRHVLDRMLETGKITSAEHAELIGREIPFARGTFRYDTNVLIDEVAARLEQAPFPAIFAELGIDNPSTAGIQVVTTIDLGAQQGATYALWHHLTEAGPLLEGAAEDWPGAAAFRLPDDDTPKHDPHAVPQRWDFRKAVVTAAAGGDSPSMMLDLGGHDCVVDGDGVKRVATVVARAAKGNPWHKARTTDIDAVVDVLSPGSVVWASVRTEASDDDVAHCDLELRPTLQGAVMVLEDGQIRAMVGGNDNKNFNRAVTAQRQLGSTWKPVIYFAALQLGWTPTDVLDNHEGQAFRFEGSWYYPRPDHHSEPLVSLAWAGTRSENVASIWLLAHLLDHLDDSQLRKLAVEVDLVQRKGEDRAAWIRRIRDDWGIISTGGRLPEVAFGAVKAELVADLEQAGELAEARELQALSFGSGARSEEARLSKQRGAREKLAQLRFNLLRLEELSDRCVAQAAALQSAMDEGGTLRPDQVEDLRLRPHGGTLQLGCGDTGEGWATVGEHLLAAVAEGVQIPLGPINQMRVDGRLRRDTLVRLRRAMTRRALVLRQADLWSLDVLVHHPDYRLLVGMRYVALLAKKLGVRQDLPPVLSLPLGAVDISLQDAALLYQGMLAGDAWHFPGQLSLPGGVGGSTRIKAVDSPPAGPLLIAEIRDRTGAVLYRARPQAVSLTEPAIGRETGDILRNVVRWGTGRRANGTITLNGKAVPVAGKTGTTNGYRNAAFVGFVPKVASGPDGPLWRWGQGYTVAVYVGYDDNRPMRRGSVRLQGANGALPAWIGTAQALADGGLLGGGAMPATGEWETGEGFRRVAVAQGSGLPLQREAVGEEGAPAGEGTAQQAAKLDASERSVLVARTHGLLGFRDDIARIIAPVGAAGLKLSTPAVPMSAVPMAPSAEEAVVEAPAVESAEPPEDAVQAWLGEYLEDPALDGEPVHAPAPEAVDAGSAEPPSQVPADSGVVDPRIGQDEKPQIVPRIAPPAPSPVGDAPR